MKRVGDQIGRTIKVDATTLVASKGKFARVCVEVDLQRPLKAGYRLREENWRLQYGELHGICFSCGYYYGHGEEGCPLKLMATGVAGAEASQANIGNGAYSKRDEARKTTIPDLGDWRVV